MLATVSDTAAGMVVGVHDKGYGCTEANIQRSKWETGQLLQNQVPGMDKGLERYSELGVPLAEALLYACAETSWEKCR